MEEKLINDIARDLMNNYHRRSAIEQAKFTLYLILQSGYVKPVGEMPDMTDEDMRKVCWDYGETIPANPVKFAFAAVNFYKAKIKKWLGK